MNIPLLVGSTPGPMLWYLNRGTGIVLLVLFTASTCLGLLAARSRAGGRVPAFVGQALHRNLSLISVALLAVHAATSVLDAYVDIRWWQVFSPVGATYEPLWLGLGALSLDLIAVVVLSSLFRTRMSQRSWRVLHWLGYLAWPVAVAHGVGIGTDATVPWARWIGYLCIGAVTVALLARWTPVRHPAARRTPELAR